VLFHVCPFSRISAGASQNDLTARRITSAIDFMKSTSPFRTLFAVALWALLALTCTLDAVAHELVLSDGGISKVYRLGAGGRANVIATVFDAGGLAFDAAGNLYVADYNESIIYQIGPNGTLRRFASGNQISNPSFLVFDSTGNLFVAHNGSGPGIAKIAPDGTISRFVSHSEPSGLAFDSTGNLFAADGLSSTVVKYAPDGTGTTFATGFGAPIGLAFDSSGNLFVSDLVDGVIYKITPDGTKTPFATGLRGPVGVALDQDDNLFVVDYPSVLKFTPDGTRSTFATGFAGPYDLAFRPDTVGQ
jgi:sugar lactone lactonase YvrE